MPAATTVVVTYDFAIGEFDLVAVGQQPQLRPEQCVLCVGRVKRL